MARALMVAILVTACATPYQPMGARGGYAERAIGHGRWMVQFAGNGFTSGSTARDYVFRRASELCPDGFTVQDSESSNDYSTASFDGGKTQQLVSKPSASVVVQCDSAKDKAAAAQAGEALDVALSPPTRQAPAQAPYAPWWCSSPDQSMGSFSGGAQCNRSKSDCDEFVAYMAKGGTPMTACSGAVVAACFRERWKLSGRIIDVCAPTFASCKDTAKFRAARASDDIEVLSDCERTE